LWPLTSLGEDGVRVRKQFERRSAGRFLQSKSTSLQNHHQEDNHVSTTRRSAKFAALAVCVSFIVASCGGSDDDATDSTTGSTPAVTEPTGDSTAPVETEAPDSTETADTTEGTATDGTAAEGDETAKMRITYEIADTANWEDGSPITAADYKCTWQAILNTPGSLATTGYDQIISVEPGASDKEVIVDWKTQYAAYKNVFSLQLIKAAAVDDCMDVSEAFDGGITYSGREYMIDSWSDEQLVLVPNPGYTGERSGGPERIVVVPAEDGPTLLKAGTVDFIFPQAYTGIDEELADPNVDYSAANGGSYEALYFQQVDGPFADPIFREAFSESYDRQALYDQIYAPFAQGTPLLDCGPLAPGPYCDDVFAGGYDPEGAATLLEENGWTKDAEGFWADADGVVPEIRWLVNTGNTRRESSQEFMIPLLAEAGFKVAADNCEALPCMFETRIPSLDYDMTTYISTVSPDPAVLTTSFACDQIPTEENGFQGQNSTGWCNEEATADLKMADETVDEAARTELVKSAIQFMADDHILLPLLQFPNIGAFRTDKVANTNAELANYRAINDWYQWEDVDGDGTIVIGAEQFPTADCPNPVTECANSSWYVWMISFPVSPGPYVTTSDQTYVLDESMASEPVVELL
jgi:peptide/nickel transport system substrate-binding protein